MNPQDPQITIYQTDEENNSRSRTILFIVFIIWVVLGIAAFIMSIICFGRSGSDVQHVVGLLLAIFLGPFFWIFYFFVPGYCKRLLS